MFFLSLHSELAVSLIITTYLGNYTMMIQILCYSTFGFFFHDTLCFYIKGTHKVHLQSKRTPEVELNDIVISVCSKN